MLKSETLARPGPEKILFKIKNSFDPILEQSRQKRPRPKARPYFYLSES